MGQFGQLVKPESFVLKQVCFIWFTVCLSVFPWLIASEEYDEQFNRNDSPGMLCRLHTTLHWYDLCWMGMHMH